METLVLHLRAADPFPQDIFEGPARCFPVRERDLVVPAVIVVPAAFVREKQHEGNTGET
jgi:hypothetical protein